jgi:hypothetical protein
MVAPTLYFEGDVKSLPRFDTYAALDLIRIMEPETEILMQELALRELVEDEYDSPHGRAWHVSMHASEFPGIPDEACSRYLAYRMMNYLANEPMPPWVTTTGTVGKAGELDLANAWFEGGRMLAVPEDPSKPEINQLGFVDELRWMTASTDLPVLPFGWRKPYIVEVKCKADDVVEAMLQGEIVRGRNGGSDTVIRRGPDKKHVVQLGATIGKAHEYDWGQVTVCSKCWFILGADVYQRLSGQYEHPRSDSHSYCPRCKTYEGNVESFELEPPDSGEIYYWSRSWPRKTKSFFQTYDAEFMSAGLQVVEQTQKAFINDRLPVRPDHFGWSTGACKFCRFKPQCRKDEGLVKPRARKPSEPPTVVLSQSHQLIQTMGYRPHYDGGQTRAKVFKEWGLKDPNPVTMDDQRLAIVDMWNSGRYPEGTLIHEALGMTPDEYAVWNAGIQEDPS